MKKIIPTIFYTISLLCISPSCLGLEPAPDKGTGIQPLKLSTNQLAEQGYQHILAMHKAMQKLDTKDQGKSVATIFKREINSLTSIRKSLENATKPNDNQIKDFATILLKSNADINKSRKLTRNDLPLKDQATYDNISPMLKQFKEEHLLFSKTVTALYPPMKLEAFLKQSAGNTIWKVLIEVHQNDEKTKHIPPLIFAQRQAEIMLSRNVLLAVIKETALGKRLDLNHNDSIRFLEDSYSYKITKGGLIQLECKLSKYTDENSLNSLAKILLDTLPVAYRANHLKHQSEAKKNEIKTLTDIIRNQENQLEEVRMRHRKAAKRLAPDIAPLTEKDKTLSDQDLLVKRLILSESSDLLKRLQENEDREQQILNDLLKRKLNIEVQHVADPLTQHSFPHPAKVDKIVE